MTREEFVQQLADGCSSLVVLLIDRGGRASEHAVPTQAALEDAEVMRSFGGSAIRYEDYAGLPVAYAEVAHQRVAATPMLAPHAALLLDGASEARIKLVATARLDMLDNLIRPFEDYRLTVAVKLRITTSGYADRFITHDTTWCSNYTGASPAYDAKFGTEGDLFRYLKHVGGADVANAQVWDAIHGAETQRTITGSIGPGACAAMPVTAEDELSIDALLNLRLSGRFTVEGIARFQQQLDRHPISADLMALVNYHLAECDRRNVYNWGHPDGRAPQEAA